MMSEFTVRRSAFSAIRLSLLTTLCAVAFLLAATPPSVWAQNGTSTAQPGFSEELAKPITTWNAALERIDTSLNEESVSDAALEAARASLDELQDQIDVFARDLRPRVDTARAQAEKLGAAPAAGQPAEPEAVAQQRTELNKSLADLSAALKAAETALVRTNDLSSRTRDLRRQLFERRVMQRTLSPLAPSLWLDVGKNAPANIKQLGMILTDWWNRIASQPLFLAILGGAVLLWSILAFGVSRAVRHFRRWNSPEPPSEWQRAASAAWVILVRALPAAITGTFLYFALTTPGFMPPPAVELALAAIGVFVIVAAVRAVSRTALTIRHKEWRLVPLSDEGAAKLYRRLLPIAILYGLDTFITTLNRVTGMPFSLSVAQTCIASLLVAYLIISILRIRALNGDDSGELHPIGPRYVRAPLWLIAFGIIGTTAAGYVALAHFIASQLIVTGTILLVAYLFMFWASAFAQSLADDETVAGKNLGRHVRLSQRHREQLNLPVTLLLRGMVLLIAVPLVLLQWGFDARDVAGWFEKALFGFDVGKIHISLTAVFLALIIFIAAYAAAKAFQSWLDNHVLAPAGVDESLRDSVRTGVGYLGVGAAVLLAVSYTGMDFSNLAILAGALSVGLGFGLQSIVNNFVSGLILLAERQVKVGDWIVVGTDEGTVRRISVRSTEIETFDRANVIIPNSQLISQSVKNWTLHNNIGRLGITVGVAYDADPEKVRDILLEVAKLHPQVLSTPEPFVSFDDFAESTLNFSLYVYLSNVTRGHAVRTDLRIAILKVFQARGILMPYRQSEVQVHLADLDWIKRAIIQRMAKQDASGDEPVVTVKERNFDAESGPLKPGKFDARNGGKKKDDDEDDGDDGADGGHQDGESHAAPAGGNGNRTP